MKIIIDGKSYTLSEQSEKVIGTAIAVEANKALENFPFQYKLIGEQMARKMLYDFEKKAIENGAAKEDAIKLRPTKNESPLTKMLDIVLTVNAGNYTKGIILYLTTQGDEVGMSYETV
jgi:hypothetical protein